MIREVFLQVAALALITAPFAAAQRPGGPGQGNGTPPTPAQMVASKVARLTVLLGLTTQQQTDATNIFTAEQTALAALDTNQQTAYTALDAAVKKNDLTGINAAATQLGALDTQEIVAHAKADAAFYALLTADQKTKFDTVKLAGMDGPGGPGRPGGPGGRH